MTISSTTRRAGPFAGNGVVTTFPFAFKVFDKTNLTVVTADTDGGNQLTLTLDSDYSVALNADQNSDPGGTITYPILGTPMPTGTVLAMIGGLLNTQPTDITNNGGFYPSVLEDMGDRSTIQIQQLAEAQARALTFPPIDNVDTAGAALPSSFARANKALGFDANGAPIAVDLTFGSVLAPVLHSITTLRLLSKLVTTDAFVLGYYAAGDGGGGAYYRDPYDTTSADNGGTIIVAADGGRWKLQNSGPVAAPQFGARGNGTTDDSAQFAVLETAFANTAIDLMGRTYVVSSYPSVNRYFNGSFLISGTAYSAPFSAPVRIGNDLILLGTQAGAALPNNYQHPVNIFSYTSGVIALGPRTMANMTDVQNSVAIGFSAMEHGTKSFDNMAIGEVALQNVSSNSAAYSSTDLTGTRNIGIGGNALQFLTTGNQNVALGRNTLTSAVSVVGAVAIGSNALMGGGATGGWTPTIVNWWPNTNTAPNTLTAVGAYAANAYTGHDITAIGGGAGSNLTRATNCTMVGVSAGLNLESNLLPNGHTQVIPSGGSFSATYSVAAGVVTVNYPGHSAVAGQIVGFRIPDGPIPTNGSHAIYYPVTSVIDANTFTVSTPLPGTGTGTFIVYTFDQGVAGTACTQNTFVGASAGHAATTATVGNTVVGFNAASVMDNSTGNTVVGGSAATLTTSMSSSTLLGANAGSSAGKGSATLTQCTFIGVSTGYQYVNGTVPASYTNVSILGFNALVSGDNQVQLGNSATTTYVYGTVQNRSDQRDKADIRDTVLGLDFINALRPVDYKWDMREDYIETTQTGVDAEGNPTFETVTLPKDGSKMRKRYHHGLIAQEVQALIQQTGVDFGGFQNHALEGGSDVLTIGYDELVGPLIKAVQQQSQLITALTARVAALEQGKTS